MTFTALVLRRDDPEASPTVAVETLDDSLLPDGEVTVDVTHSSINYKDALVLAGRPGLVREHPHVPGIDLAGTVRSSDDPAFAPCDEVLVPGAWLVRRPAGMDARRAMALGTAGFTAQLAVDTLERGGVRPGDGPVLVTGATGGVGAVAVMLLAHAGHEVEASTGSSGDTDVDALLADLGATRTLPREEVSGAAGRALGSARWAGVVDVAGGATLAGALAQTRPRGVVAACGLADDAALSTTVMPFIVRGVTLVGIDSVLHPVPERPAVWARLHATVDPALLERITTTVGLADVPARAATLLATGVRGRTVVDTRA
jgi:acrylyl-CoA reductase (NADPH)